MSRIAIGSTIAVRIRRMIQTANALPWITTACAALFLTSGSFLPTKRKMRLPIGGNRAQARIVLRFLFPPTALVEPPIGAVRLGGGGGLCDIYHSPPVGLPAVRQIIGAPARNAQTLFGL